MSTRIEPARLALGRLVLACATGCLLALLSCASNGGPTGGETHFLARCEATTQTCDDGLSCVCGVCSVPCTAATQCLGLPSAECLPIDPSACSDGQTVSRCDVPCNDSTDCRGLSSAHVCEFGACRTGASGVSNCAHGEVQANEVVLLGDSFFAASHQITAYLEGLARAAGALPDGQRYRDNSTMIGNALALGGNGIAAQYERAQADAAVRVVIMNGGGADTLGSHCEPPIAECQSLLDAAAAAEELFARMAENGVAHVVYASYPDPLDASVREKVDTLRPLIEGACASSPVPCHWLDLRPTFANRYDEFILADGMNPTETGSQASAQAIWATMQRDCIAQ